MRRLLLACLLLAACGREAPEPPAASFRDRSIPIGSTTRGNILDFAGDWEITQAFPGAALAIPGTHLRVEPGEGATALLRFEGPGGARDVPVAMGVPGRLSPRAEGDPELWLLWVDDDFRTAVVGTPDGSLGWIMNRPGQASPDRTVAAREVLEWSGYDVTRLVP